MIKLSDGVKTSFVNGCFDILHRGHIQLFKYACSLGDRVVVGIDSDERVAYLKGASRPVNSQNDRKFMLESIRYIDEVIIFNSEEELEKLIQKVAPATMIVGEEYKNKRVIGHTKGIELKFFRGIHGYSTTDIITNIAGR